MIQLSSRHVVPRIQIVRVPRGTEGTLRTAKIIGRLIQEAQRIFTLDRKRLKSFELTECQPKNRMGEACALFDFVKRNIRYTRDIFRVELLAFGAKNAGTACG